MHVVWRTAREKNFYPQYNENRSSEHRGVHLTKILYIHALEVSEELRQRVQVTYKFLMGTNSFQHENEMLLPMLLLNILFN